MIRLRRVALVAVALCAVSWGALGVPHGVAAHALRQSSTPDADTILQVPPDQVSITFGERPDPSISTIQVLDTSGRQHQSGSVSASAADPRTLSVAVDHLGSGVYTVSWRTLSAVDGHRAAGTFAFGVGVEPAQLAAASGQGGSVTDTSPGPSALAVLGRVLLYVGLLTAFGGVLVGVLVLGGPGGSRRAVLLQGLAGAVVAAAGTAVVVVTQAQDAGTGLAGLVASEVGRTVVERLLAAAALLALAGIAFALRGRARDAVLLGAGAAAALAMLVDVSGSHAAAGSWVWANVLLQWVHVAAVGVWIGGLGALVAGLRREPGAGRGRAVRRFSTAAGVALAAVLATGTIRAAVEIGSWGSVLTTGFGRVVCVKAGLVAILALLGAVNRWRNVPRAARVLGPLRRIGGAELAVATAAVVAAALLVNLAPPASAGAATAGPSPAPLVLDGSDYGTTVRLVLTVSPGTPGFDTFGARVTDYDTGRDVGARAVQLGFSLPSRPELGPSRLALKQAADGVWMASGANLSLDGVWSVTALVQRGSQSSEVRLSLPTRTGQKVDVNAAAGQPTLYTVHLDRGRTCQWYLDPQAPGRDAVHATFFDAGGNGLATTGGTLTGTAGDGTGTPVVLAVTELEPGHYVGQADLGGGVYRFDMTAQSVDGSMISAHVDITLGASQP